MFSNTLLARLSHMVKCLYGIEITPSLWALKVVYQKGIAVSNKIGHICYIIIFFCEIAGLENLKFLKNVSHVYLLCKMSFVSQIADIFPHLQWIFSMNTIK